MNIHYDSTTPGSRRAPGYWSNQAWISIPLSERRQLQNLPVLTYGAHVSVSQTSRHQASTPSDRCLSCGTNHAQVKGKCRRCYYQEYFKTYRRHTAFSEKTTQD